jgi:pyruvate,water dikinase
MLSTERNEILSELATILSGYPAHIRAKAAEGNLADIEDPVFSEKLHQLQEKFGTLFDDSSGLGASAETEKIVLSLVCEYAKRTAEGNSSSEKQKTEEIFLAGASQVEMPFSGEEILDLGRASYRLRDDDNIYLGKIEKQLSHAVAEGRRRMKTLDQQIVDSDDMISIVKVLRGEELPPKLQKEKTSEVSPSIKTRIKARQLIGQPASKGIARGPCRLIYSKQDLAGFKQGEILVVDAIDPNMTFIAPLASAIVERRGGMLIHGAIIAREYGIPCVTGIPDALQLIQNGETITVDGYLGIVTLGESSLE